MKDPKDHGYWAGDVFHFTPPLEFNNEDGLTRTVAAVDLSQMILTEGVSRDEVIEALLNPLHHTIEGEPDA